jgi:hypothetical protein
MPLKIFSDCLKGNGRAGEWMEEPGLAGVAVRTSGLLHAFGGEARVGLEVERLVEFHGPERTKKSSQIIDID